MRPYAASRGDSPCAAAARPLYSRPMTPDALDPVLAILKREFERHRTPVVELIQSRTQDPFQVLVATILSARTLDQTTAAVCRRLFAEVRSLADLRRIPAARLQRLIYPVGFFRTKTAQLKRLPDAVDTLFSGRIPATVEELVRLPGVGRKTANLVAAVAFEQPAICVDVHVHRISNRWGYIRTKTPLESEMALRKILPDRHWLNYNSFLVAFGQNLCTPRKPRCAECPIHQYCKRVGV